MSLTTEQINSKVVFAIRNCYNDNDGAYHIAYFLSDDKKKIYQQQYSNGYNNVAFDDVKVNASEADIQLARQIYIDKHMSISDRDSYIGCTVKLSRSKKAPNNTKMLVVEERVNNCYAYNRKQPDVVDLIHIRLNQPYNNISKSCVCTIVKGAAPHFF